MPQTCRSSAAPDDGHGGRDPRWIGAAPVGHVRPQSTRRAARGGSHAAAPFCRKLARNRRPRCAEGTSMATQQAQTLQLHALDALGQLRSWLGARAAELPPTAPVTGMSQAEGTADYVAWAAQVDAVLRAVGRAFPECEKQHAPAPGSNEPEAESAPPTLPSRQAVHAIFGA